MSHETSYTWVYILECADGTLYTGYTTDIHRRLSEHQKGSLKCKYTASKKRRPVSLKKAWTVPFPKGNALRLESFIKTLSRSVKLEIIENPQKLVILYKNKKGIPADVDIHVWSPLNKNV